MLDDFLVRALVAGTGIALVAGPLGCFIVWRRLAYFGDTLSHAALLGVVLAVLLQINVTLAVFLVSAVTAASLFVLMRWGTLSSDALLGLLAHSTLAIALVVLSFFTAVRVDLMGLLFGDILSVSRFDIAIIWGGGFVALGVLAYFWRRLFAATVSREMAAAEGLRPDLAEMVFFLLVSGVIAISLKLVGALLITAMLLIPAAAARRFASGPETMAVLAAILGILAVFGGLFGSLNFDTPSGPSIVVAATAIFLLSLTPLAALYKQASRRFRNVGSSSRELS